MSEDIINTIDEAVTELRTYMDLLESIKAQLQASTLTPEDRASIESSVDSIRINARDFSGSVTDLLYALQQASGYKIRIIINA